MILSGKVALVTGGARGIGLACAREFLREGASVAIVDIDGDVGHPVAAGLSSEFDPTRIAFIQADVSDADAVSEVLRVATETFGGLDIALNNAAIVLKGTILDLEPEALDQVYRVNLRGYFLVSQAAARQMVAQGRGGSIINMSSVNGQVTIAEQLAYCMMKGGVNQLTKATALALATKGIRCNAVAPGSINTELFRVVVADEAARRAVLSRTPMGRPGEPSEVARVCVFLAGPDSSYMTGEVIVVDGGRMPLNYVVPV